MAIGNMAENTWPANAIYVLKAQRNNGVAGVFSTKAIKVNKAHFLSATGESCNDLERKLKIGIAAKM